MKYIIFLVKTKHTVVSILFTIYSQEFTSNKIFSPSNKWTNRNGHCATFEYEAPLQFK